MFFLILAELSLATTVLLLNTKFTVIFGHYVFSGMTGSL
jgi:hypothetical protein